MPTSAAGTSTSKRRTVSGFTLIELLVVLFIVALLMGAVLFSPGVVGIERRLENGAARLAGALELATEQSVLTGRDLAASFTETGCQFLEMRGDAWSPLRKGMLASPLVFEPGTDIALTLNGVTLDPSDPEIQGEPHVILFSSGEVLPFNLELSHPASPTRFVLSREDSRFTISEIRDDR